MIKRSMADLRCEKYNAPESKEYAEAEEQSLYGDAHAAVEFIGMLTQKVYDGEYDEDFDDFVQVAVKLDGDIALSMVPLKGFKKLPSARIRSHNESDLDGARMLEDEALQDFLKEEQIEGLYCARARAISVAEDQSKPEQPIMIVLQLSESSKNQNEFENVAMALTPKQAKEFGERLIKDAEQYEDESEQ